MRTLSAPQVLIGRGIDHAALRASFERALGGAGPAGGEDVGDSRGAAGPGTFRALCDGDVRLVCEASPPTAAEEEVGSRGAAGGVALVRLTGQVTPFVAATPARADALHQEVACGMSERGVLPLVVYGAVAGGGAALLMPCADAAEARRTHAALEAALLPALAALFMEVACC